MLRFLIAGLIWALPTVCLAAGNLADLHGKFPAGGDSKPISKRYVIPAGKGILTYFVSHKPWLGGIRYPTKSVDSVQAQGCKDNFATCSGSADFLFTLGQNLYVSLEPKKKLKEETLPNPWVQGQEAKYSVSFEINPKSPVEMIVLLGPQKSCNLAGICPQFGSESWVQISYTPQGPTTTTSSSTSSSTNPSSGHSGATGDATGETSWSVGAVVDGRRMGAHPTPWVFHRDGTVEASGFWKGTWTRETGGDYQVTIISNGVRDQFTVKFQGNAFIAYKQGSAYRYGTRIK